jgi:hypothetical protein
MMNRTLVTLLIFFSAFSVNAQKTMIDDVIKSNLLTPYVNHFAANHEMIYTQFNKSSYLTGDDIWFTSWIMNPLDKHLSFNTTKLYVELWSGEKRMINRKILFVNGGTASNFIHLEDTLAPGTYCFRAYTSWMRNFYEEKEFNNSITILAPTGYNKNGNLPSNKSVLTSTSKPKVTFVNESGSGYDIQFLPEGGHFIEDLTNIIGVKVTDVYGRGVAVKGQVIDSAKNEIAAFETNKMGMSRIVIANASKSNYKAIIELPEGGTREVKMQDPEKQGVGINVTAYLKGLILVRLQINPLTRSLNQSYFLMIHSNGVNFKNYHIGFKEDPSVQIMINKEDLGNGIIYATLFNEDLVPIAERIFYNQKGIVKGKISITTNVLINDSVSLSIKSTDSLSVIQVAKFSISVLPEGTSMNNFKSSLLTESLLRPALKGDIENPGYYFEKNNTEHLFALDNLMLTQGWRKYEWPVITQKGNKQNKYPFETAFSIDGSVKNWIKNKVEVKSQVTIISPQNKIVILAPVDSAGEFHIRNLYFKDSTYVIASASNKNGVLWNRSMQMNIPVVSLPAPDFTQFIAPPIKKEVIDDFIPKMTKGVIRLGEVVINGQKKNPFNNEMYIGLMSRQFEVTKDNYKIYADVEHILMAYFNVRIGINPLTHEKVFDMGRGDLQFNLGSKYGDKNLQPGATDQPVPKPPVLLVDGMQVSDIDELLSIPMNTIESIAVDKSGTNFVRGGEDNGLIAITTRTTPIEDLNSDNILNFKKVIVKGYATPKEYFEPKYLLQPEDPNYAKYATIYWKPEIVTDTTGAASFKFHVPQPIKSIVVRTEGISYEGLFFLHEEMIALPKRD